MIVRKIAVALAAGASLLVAGACRKASRPEPAAKTESAEVVIDDAFVRIHMPEYPQAVLFKSEHLTLFAADKPEERRLTEESGGVYLLRGDFNGNGKPEIALAGLGSLEPIDGDYKGFVLILEMDGGAWKTVGIERFPKAVKPVGGAENLRNLLLKNLGDGEIQVGFAARTDFVGFMVWKGSRYVYTMPD
ncbi:MAG: hypothetical protein NTZ26_15645 [Candidatus Aminicenantes bacterium]|nr:hypothetical protein [Candidatus Aminicenantes bacterium]